MKPFIHHRSDRIAARDAAIELMIQVSQSKDAINLSERVVAQKISSISFSGFDSLTVEEVDDLINLIGNYWDVEGQNTIIFIDMLLEKTRVPRTYSLP